MNSSGRRRVSTISAILRRILIATLAMVLVSLLAPAAGACASCREAMANSSSGGDLVRGFFWSILFLLAMPFLIFTSLSLYFYNLIRRNRAAAESSGTRGDA